MVSLHQAVCGLLTSRLFSVHITIGISVLVELYSRTSGWVVRDHGFSTLSFLHFGIENTLLWRTALSMVGCVWPLPTRCQQHLPPWVLTTKTVSGCCQCPLGIKLSLVENHCPRLSGDAQYGLWIIMKKIYGRPKSFNQRSHRSILCRCRFRVGLLLPREPCQKTKTWITFMSL